MHSLRKVSFIAENQLKYIRRFRNIFFLIVIGSHRKKLKTMYDELIVKIEQISKIVEFIGVKLTFIGTIIPTVFITLVNYYIFDLDRDSFFLPCPT